MSNTELFSGTALPIGTLCGIASFLKLSSEIKCTPRTPEKQLHKAGNHSSEVVQLRFSSNYYLGRLGMGLCPHHTNHSAAAQESVAEHEGAACVLSNDPCRLLPGIAIRRR